MSSVCLFPSGNAPPQKVEYSPCSPLSGGPWTEVPDPRPRGLALLDDLCRRGASEPVARAERPLNGENRQHVDGEGRMERRQFIRSELMQFFVPLFAQANRRTGDL